MVLLDVMLPGADGFEVCRRLRGAERWALVIMLTARDGVHDRIRGPDAGADDYLAKPFSFGELCVRGATAPTPTSGSPGPSAGSMRFVFDLWSDTDVREHSQAILGRLSEGSMPCDGPWAQDQVAVFQRRIDDGCPP